MKTVTSPAKVGPIGGITRLPDRVVGYTLEPIVANGESIFSQVQMDVAMVVASTAEAQAIEDEWRKQMETAEAKESLEECENEACLAAWRLDQATALILAGDAGGSDDSQQAFDRAVAKWAPRKRKDIYRAVHFSVDKTMSDGEVGAVIEKSLGQLVAGPVQSLAGLELVVTGTLSRPRVDVEAAICAAGGRIGRTVNNKTNYLVAGEKTGLAKTNKAASLEVRVITEAELTALMIQGVAVRAALVGSPGPVRKAKKR